MVFNKILLPSILKEKKNEEKMNISMSELKLNNDVEKENKKFMRSNSMTNLAVNENNIKERMELDAAKRRVRYNKERDPKLDKDNDKTKKPIARYFGKAKYN